MQKAEGLQYWEQPSYLLRVGARFSEEVQAITSKYNIKNLVLVVDCLTMVSISNLFKVPDLVKMKVTFIERLEKDRKKLNYHALYFVTPTDQNITALIKDFKDSENPQYKKIHILFSTFIDKSVLKKLSSEKLVLKKIARNSIKEFYHSVRLVQENTLTMEIDYLSVALSKDSEEELRKRIMISNKLVQILANIGQLNTIRIYYKKQANTMSQRVAQQFSRVTKHYLGCLLQNQSYIVNRYASDVTFLFLDRSVDPVTPLLHSFTYEAMLFDLMKVSYEGQDDLEDKEYYSFSEIQDEIFQLFRYQHISHALEQLPQELNLVKQGMEKAKESSEVDFQELSHRLSCLKRHINLITEIWKQFQTKNMQTFGELEQSLATGLSETGKNTSSSQLYEEAIKMMRQPFVTKEERVRLGLLVLTCIKLSKKDYQNLTKQFDEADRKILKNIIALGVGYDSKLGKSTKAISKQQQNIASKRMKTTGMALNRYTPLIELLIPMVLNVLDNKTQQQGLDHSLFGSQQVALFQNQYQKFDSKKFVFFMCGGFSYAQVCSLRSHKQLEKMIIVTDSLLDPKSFVESLQKIDIL